MHIISDNIVSLIQKLIQYTRKSPNWTSSLEGTPHNHCSVILIKHYTEHFLFPTTCYTCVATSTSAYSPIGAATLSR